jgi:PAS domain S-box-containing protein
VYNSIFPDWPKIDNVEVSHSSISMRIFEESTIVATGPGTVYEPGGRDRRGIVEGWTEDPPRFTSVRFVAASLLLIAIYFICGKLGLRLASVHPNATLVWAPAGIALATLLLLGYRMWPTVFIGALLVSWTTGSTGFASIGIAIGNTLEALLGAYLVNRFADGLKVFDRSTSTLRFIVLAGMLSTAVSATLGVTTLVVAGLAAPEQSELIWLIWWLGDASGVLTITPVLILYFVDQQSFRWNARRAFEALVLMAALLSVSLVAYDDPLSLKFLAIPVILWSAFRFGRMETALWVLLLSGFAIWSILHGPARTAASDDLLTIQAFIAVVAVMTLTLSAAISERAQADAALRSARDQLAGEVKVTGRALAGAEQLSRFQENLLSRAERVAHAGSFQWDIATNRVTWSQGMNVIYDRAPAEFAGTFEAFLSFVHPEDVAEVRANVERSMIERQPFRTRERILRPNGEARVLDSIGEPLLDSSGRLIGMYGVCRDITSEYESEKRLVQSEERWRLLVQKVKDHAIFMLDADGRVATWNEGAARIKGYKAEEVIGQRLSSFYTPEDVQSGLPTRLLKTAEAKGHVEHEGWRVRKDGSRFWASVSITALRDDQGRLKGFAKVTRDLTERRQAELAYRELSGRILKVQDEEQRRIALELHDSTSPLLTELIGKLYAVKRQMGASVDTTKTLDDSLTLAEHASTVIRETCSLLHPAMLDQGGLLPTLRWYLSSFERRTEIHVETSFPKALILPREAEITLFRVVEECMTNVLQHSGSKTAQVSITEKRDTVTLEVCDSGRGLAPGILLHSGGVASLSGIGIQGMMERMKRLGGKLEIDSGYWGTSVKAILRK